MRSAAQLLVVSPENAVLQAARRSLAALGHAPLLARSLRQARRMLAATDVDLICLDSALGVDKTERLWSCAFAGRDRSPPPLILLVPHSVRPGSPALPAFFEPKRDGLLPQPLRDGALAGEVARLLAARLRRERRAGVLRAGSVMLDSGTRQLHFASSGTVSLTPTECRLVGCLMQHPGVFVPTDELLEKVWGYPPGTGGREVLRAHVSNVRRKLRLQNEDPRLLRNIPLQGYSFVPTEETLS
jgi:DNA-binding response OmpR family regulator